MSAYKDIVAAHLAFLADVDGADADTGNLVRQSDGAVFTFVRAGMRERELVQTEAGAYTQAGELVRGFVAFDGRRLAVADVVTFEARPWRVVAAVDVSTVGAEVASQEVSLLGLEA